MKRIYLNHTATKMQKCSQASRVILSNVLLSRNEVKKMTGHFSVTEVLNLNWQALNHQFC